MSEMSGGDRRVLDRMLQADRIKATAAGVKAKIAQVLAGIKTVDQVAEEEAREKEELREMAIRDQLTGAWNKHYMNAVIHHEVRSGERKSSPLGMIFLDLDHFKEVNDAEPDKHEAGDRTLMALRMILEGVGGEAVEVGRWGGEEWIILGAGMDQAEMKRLGEVMGQAVKQRLASEARLVRKEVTASLGVVTWLDGETAKELIQRADQAMYKAKELGRNRMVIAGETQEVVEFGG